jgi:hypothetical protein
MTLEESTPSGKGRNPPPQIGVWREFQRAKYPDGPPRPDAMSDQDFLDEFRDWARKNTDLVRGAGMVCPHGVTEVCCVLCHAAGRQVPLTSPAFAVTSGPHGELRLPLCRGHARAAREIWNMQMGSPETLERLRRETEEQ